MSDLQAPPPCAGQCREGTESDRSLATMLAASRREQREAEQCRALDPDEAALVPLVLALARVMARRDLGAVT